MGKCEIGITKAYEDHTKRCVIGKSIGLYHLIFALRFVTLFANDIVTEYIDHRFLQFNFAFKWHETMKKSYYYFILLCPFI